VNSLHFFKVIDYDGEVFRLHAAMPVRGTIGTIVKRTAAYVDARTTSPIYYFIIFSVGFHRNFKCPAPRELRCTMNGIKVKC